MSKIELFNYRDNCRLCLKTHTDLMKNIFTHCVEGYQDTLVQNIFALFKVELNSHKDFPQFICRKCLTEVENILLFKEDLQRNQDLLFSLFTAAYPNCVEKTLHTPNHSKDFDSTRQSVAINTNPEIDFKNLGDSEYVRVPVNFLKQFSPQIILRTTEVRALGKKSPEIREEIAQDDSLSISVNICKYCNKAFRSQTLVNTHCKEVHKLEEQKNDSTRKRIPGGVQEPLAKKIKRKGNVLLSSRTNMHDLPIECGSFPQMDLENNNACMKEELHSPPDQQVDKILAVIRQQRQALFLQNFNLIAKQEAASIKTNQKALKRLSSKRHSLKKQISMKKPKKPVVKPLQFKNSKIKILVKPLPRKNDHEILSRSVQFLKRYGWRKLNSSSRQGTLRNSDKNSLFENTTKSTTKKGSLKNSINRFVLKEKGCERAQNLDSFDRMHELPLLLRVKVNENNLRDSSRNRNLEERSSCTTANKSSSILKESASTSTIPDKVDVKTSSSKNSDDVNTKLKTVVKDEALSSNGVKTIEYNSISSQSFYDRKESSASVEQVLDPSLVDLDSWEDLARNANTNKSTRKSEQLVRKSRGNKSLTTSHNAHMNLKKIDRKPTLLQSVRQNSLMPTNDLQIKKELLQIQLQSKTSPGNHNGFSESSFDFKVGKHNLERPKNNSDVFLATKVHNHNQLLIGRGLRRNNSTAVQSAGCSKSCPLLASKKRGRPMLKQTIKDELILTSTCNHSQIFNDELTNTMVTVNNNVKTELPKKGRPKRNPVSERCSSSSTANTILGNNSPLLNLTQDLPSLSARNSKKPSISTLQDLNDRYEKGDNIGLRMKLRKTATSQSLNSLKYDTQELDENFQINVKAIKALTDYNDVPDNKKYYKDIKKELLQDNNIVVKSEYAIPEKVVNVDLEDAEVLMLVPRYEDDIDFDNEDSSMYVKPEKRSLKVEQSFVCSKSKNDPSLEANSSCPPSINHFSDNVIKQKQFKRSQAILPHNEDESVEFDVKLSRKDYRNLPISNESGIATSIDSKNTDGKRRGRPPTKYSPSIYAVKRSQSIAELLTRRNGNDVGLTLKIAEPRSRSISQPLACAKDLFNSVHKRTPPPKEDKVMNISSPIKKNGSLNKPRKDAKPKQERSLLRKGKCLIKDQ